jgi:hypothetical protein
MRGLHGLPLPLGVVTDSYKACHAALYPPGTAELEAVRARGGCGAGGGGRAAALPLACWRMME